MTTTIGCEFTSPAYVMCATRGEGISSRSEWGARGCHFNFYFIMCSRGEYYNPKQFCFSDFLDLNIFFFEFIKSGF